MTTPALASIAHRQHQRVIELRADITARYLELGAILALIQRERLYLALGYEHFTEYLASPEVALSERTAWRVMRLTQEVGSAPAELPTLAGDETITVLTAADVAAMGLSKAELAVSALRAAGDEEERAAIVADAKALSVRDFRQSLRERRDDWQPPRSEELAAVASAIGALAARLAYNPEPARVLSDIVQVCEKARERMEAQ